MRLSPIAAALSLSTALMACADRGAEETAATRFAAVIDAAATLPEVVAAVATVDVPGETPRWIETGISLEPGASFSALAEGEVVLLDDPRVTFGPTMMLWFRVGETGEIFKGSADTSTHAVRDAGPLFVAVGRIGWPTREGTLHGGTPGPPGGFRVAFIAWKGDPASGLAALQTAAPDAAPLAAEAERLATAHPTPQGWQHLWHVGETAIYRDMDFGERKGIRAETRSDGGILKKPLDIPLSQDTTLEWSWRAHELPSKVAENSFATHDYMSIAIEFDNGQDLSYFWSAALPVGDGHRCPLPWWDQWETHVVARTGSEGLGEWHRETKRLLPDYKEHVGEPPRRIVAVWLISVSAFSKSVGRTDYADVYIVDGDRRIKVL